MIGDVRWSLTVVAVRQSARGVSVDCRCSCGGSLTLSAYEWRAAKHRSCGCRQKRAEPIAVGSRWGRLTAVEEGPRNSARMRQTICRCDCGDWTIVPDAVLRAGRTRSCGCLQLENARRTDRNCEPVLYEYDGQLRSVRWLAEQAGVSKRAMQHRVRAGWTPDRILR